VYIFRKLLLVPAPRLGDMIGNCYKGEKGKEKDNDHPIVGQFRALQMLHPYMPG